jgi:hypothetical protein
MQTLTLFVSFLGAVLVLILRPARAFAVYVAVLLWYPTFLTVPVGTLDFKAGRIVVAVLLLRCLSSNNIRCSFKHSVIDSWMYFGTGLENLLPLISYHLPFIQVLATRCGSLMDDFFAYLVARFCIRNITDLVTAIKWIGITMIPLAVLGIVESLTGWMPFVPLRIYCPWDSEIIQTAARFGFFRANGPSGHPIIFGASFAMFVPLTYSLRHRGGILRNLCYFMAVMAVLGTLSSMSSGPLVLLLVMIVCLILEHFKQLVKPLIIFGIVSCLCISIISNRTIYHVLASYINPFGGTGWYRAKLIDLAIEHFNEWWFLGYGGLDPGWGPALGSRWTDITNHYIMYGVMYGIWGVIALVGILVTSLIMIIRCYKTETDPMLKSCFWALGSLVVSFMIAFNSFTLFAQSGILFICILGIIASLSSYSLLSNLRNGNTVTKKHALRLSMDRPLYRG